MEENLLFSALHPDKVNPIVFSSTYLMWENFEKKLEKHCWLVDNEFSHFNTTLAWHLDGHTDNGHSAMWIHMHYMVKIYT